MSRALTLMIGNKKSVLSTAIMIEQNFEVYPFLVDRYHKYYGKTIINDLLGITESIDEVYGTDISGNSIPCKSFMTAHKFMKKSWTLNPKALSEEYPGVYQYQLHCMACKSAMYAHAIACAKAKDFDIITDYTMRCNFRFPSIINFMLSINKLCESKGIQLHTPLFNVDNEYDIDVKLSERLLDNIDFIERICAFDCDLKQDFTQDDIKSYQSYFENVLLPKLEYDIGELMPMYNHM